MYVVSRLLKRQGQTAALVLLGLVLLMPTMLYSQTHDGAEGEAAVVSASDVFAPVKTGSLRKQVMIESPAVITMDVLEGAFEMLRQAKDLRLVDFPLPDGSIVELALREFSVFDEHSIFLSHTDAGEIPHSAPDISLYRGRISNESASWVYLAIASDGLSGSITHNGVDYDLSTKFQAAGSNLPLLAVYEVTDAMSEYGCDVDEFDNLDGYFNKTPAPATFARDGLDTLAAKLAIEADYQAFQHYGSVDATEEYIMARLGGVAAIYERDLAVTFVVSYMKVWEVEDPYSGASASAALNSFTEYWKDNMDHVDRTLASLISRKPISAGSVSQGVAWLDQLCDKTHGYAYVKFSANNNFIKGHDGVWAHELGHNFGSHHTHSCTWNPPIDSCYTAEPARGQSPCFSSADIHLIQGGGELMSYCHMRFGGSNKHNVYRERVGALVRLRSEEALCMEVANGSGGTGGTKPSLTLLTPVGGEVICAGGELPIIWEAVKNNDFSILLSRDGGQVFDTLLIGDLPRSSRSWTWNIPNTWPVGDQYSIRIKDNKNSELLDEMDSPFATLLGTFIVDQILWRNVCVGEGAHFGVTASGAGTLTYQWKKNGVEIPGETQPDLQLEGLTEADNLSTFTCVVTGECGPVESEPAILKVFTSSVILTNLVNDTVCTGDIGEFRIEAEGSNLEYRWWFRNLSHQTKKLDNDDPVLLIPDVQEEDQGSYWCEVVSSCGMSTSKTRFLIVPEKGVTPTSPENWGDVLAAGDTYVITWTQHCLTSVKIEYTLDGGSNWTLITGSFDASAGEYLWNIPDTETDNGLFRISDANNQNTFDQSKLFKIHNLPLLAVSNVHIGFGWVAVGTSSEKTLGISNVGRADLMISRTEVEGSSDVVIKNGAPFTISPTEHYDLLVEYVPGTADRMEGMLRIEHNGGTSPTLLTLFGEGFIATSAGDVPKPASLQLHQNYPNPVTAATAGHTMIAFETPLASQVSVKVYSILGREVKTLYNGFRRAGRHEMTIDMSGLPAGQYLYRLTTGQQMLSKTMQIVK